MMSKGSDLMCASEEKPVPKSSSARRTALILEAAHDPAGEIHIGEQRAFGNFDHQPVSREGSFGKHAHDAFGEPAVGELAGRNVD